jgi:pyrroloquinoline quinone biosynthesis protein B
LRAQPRTQESIAVSANAGEWFLLNASPEVREQIERCSALHPTGARGTPIQGILLTNGDLDHCLGLLSLRESQPLTLYATEPVWYGFTQDNVLFRTLKRFPDQVRWVRLELGVTQPLLRQGGEPSGLVVCANAVPGKLPIHLVGREPSDGDNVALRVTEVSTGKALAYAPAVANLSPAVERAVGGTQALFFDGTFWSRDELVRQGLGTKYAHDMAHWPVGEADGSLSWLRTLSIPQRILIHLNNTNPLLREDSPEYRALVDAGLSLAYDGMELSL